MKELFECLVMPDLHVPIFERGFPVHASPLIRLHRSAASMGRNRASASIG
jgi:lysyl-tRNA synthetase class II